MAPPTITILGAGVIGMTVAYLLTDSDNEPYDVTIVAEHMPGDESPFYTSPWAGANYLPMSAPGSSAQRWEKDTGPFLWRLAEEVPVAGIKSTPVTLLNRNVDHEGGNWAASLHSHRPWFVDSVRDFRYLDPTELPPGFDTGNTFTSLCIDVPVYLRWLYCRLKERGVHFIRRRVQSIKEVADHHATGRAMVVVSCPGFEATTLEGVRDEAIYPARGQICLVRNESHGLLTTSGTDDGEGEIMYVQPRADGTTVLGGTYQEHSWSTKVDPDQAHRIMQRCIALCPELTAGKGPEALDVIRHTVGLRPVRKGGPRLEAETIDGVSVVHCYGHGGYGYQCSFGCALEVKTLLDRAIQSLQSAQRTSTEEG